MKCIVTAGPTFEPMDQVRRLTNFSTGRLGIELAGILTDRGHEVFLLVGEQATWAGARKAKHIQMFSTAADLSLRLEALGETPVDAVFHAAAVGDFTFGKIWNQAADGEMEEMRSGKISSRAHRLLAELIPTPKIINHLRDWFETAVLVGWKYEVEGERQTAIKLGEQQIAECHTNACVVNGKAYGEGFGIATGPAKCAHLADAHQLYIALEAIARKVLNV